LIDKPCIVQSIEQAIAFIRLTIPRSEIQNAMGPAFNELMEALAKQGITPAGPWFNHHLRMEPDTFDFRLSIPISSPFSATGRVQPGVMPTERVARTVYHGAYEGLADAWGEFDAWIAAESLTIGPDLWECYLTGPESSSNPSDWQTELNRPLRVK
jgi:effector-binding domain-containing protein